MSRVMARRRFLATTALSGAAAALVVRDALALTVAPKNAEIEAQYLAACSTRDGTYHKKLVADIKAELQGRASDGEIEAAIARATCPVCGCPITTF